jgi:hypothetical protein
MAMIAPVRCAANVVAATTTSSIVSSGDSRLKYLKNGARPKWASARRMSDWKITIAAKPM